MTESDSIRLADYVNAIRRRWRIVFLLVLLVTGVAVAVSLLGTKRYDATAQLLFRPESQVERLINPGAVESRDPERQLNTDVELIKLEANAEAVRKKLNLETGTEQLLEQLETETSSTSDIVSVTARALEPDQAAAIANAFVDEYVAYSRRSARSALLEAAEVAESEFQSLTPEDQASPEGQQLSGRSRQLRITAALQTGGVEIIKRAKPPAAPSRPRPKLSGALGLMFGLGLGVVVALLLEFTDRRLRAENDVEELFELPILGTIPPPPRRGEDHMQREAFGLLAANLRFSAIDPDNNVVLVTSPSPAEGKTSVTLGVARALARLGLRVIAIEADLRRPTFADKARLSESAGLTGLIHEPGSLARELVWLDATSMEPVTSADLKEGLAFAVLPAGQVVPHPQRLLARPGMAAVIEQARSLADVVVIDTPPVASVNDAITLSQLVNSVIVVVRLGQTTRDVARRALRSLRGIEVPVAGLVVTNARSSGQYDYYHAADDGSAVGRGEITQGS